LAELVKAANFGVLDGMRGVAAMLVLVEHAGCVMAGIDLFERNLLAVQFFFMLSGFVVACAYENRVRFGMGRGSFLSRRAWRLYPLIVFGSLCGTGALLATQPIGADASSLIRAAFLAAVGLPYTGGAFGFGYFLVNPPEWSLFFELLANLVFVVVLARLATRNLVLVSGVLFTIYGWLTCAGWPWAVPFAAEGLGAVASFGMGMAVWRGHAAGVLRVPSLPPWLLSACLVVVCLVPGSLGAGFNLAVTAILFPILIAVGASHGRMSGAGLAANLGELSYPLYILHWPTLLVARAWFPDWLGAGGPIALGCVAAVAFAWAALVLIDRPTRAWAEGLWFGKPARSRGPAVVICKNPASAWAGGS
jgi:peptidoglycan/LPS O-acetylase OafA/YrhL